MIDKVYDNRYFSCKDFHEMVQNVYNKTKDGWINISENDLVDRKIGYKNKIKNNQVVSFLISEAVLSYKMENRKRYYMWIGGTNLADIARKYFDYHYTVRKLK